MLMITGHVLGFFHEHQRRDAGQYITFHCQRLGKYDAVANWLETYPFNHPYTNRPVTMINVCTDFIIADMVELAALGFPIPRPGSPPAPLPPKFQAAQYMPFRFIANRLDLSPQGIDISAYRDMVIDSTIDWDSVMLYGSEIAGVILMTKVGKTGQDAIWTRKNVPFPGDLAAVNRLYPPMS
jgi:hypothetical protein